jgi:hypothetical protein
MMAIIEHAYLTGCIRVSTTLANDRKVRPAHCIKYRLDGDGNLKAAVLKLREQLISLDGELNAWNNHLCRAYETCPAFMAYSPKQIATMVVLFNGAHFVKNGADEKVLPVLESLYQMFSLP